MKGDKEINKRSDCPISHSLDLLGDKWTLLIMRDMLFAGKTTYGDFFNSDEQIATNILANRLQTLTQHGFISKTVASDPKSRFTYALTEKGISLLPILVELSLWGAKYSTDEVNTALPDVFKKDKEKSIREFTKVLKKKVSSESL